MAARKNLTPEPGTDTEPETDTKTPVDEKPEPTPAKAPAPAKAQAPAETFGTCAIEYAEGALAAIAGVRDSLADLTEIHRRMFTHVPVNPASTLHVRRLFASLLEMSVQVSAAEGVAATLAGHASEHEPLGD